MNIITILQPSNFNVFLHGYFYSVIFKNNNKNDNKNMFLDNPQKSRTKNKKEKKRKLLNRKSLNYRYLFMILAYVNNIGRIHTMTYLFLFLLRDVRLTNYFWKKLIFLKHISFLLIFKIIFYQ